MSEQPTDFAAYLGIDWADRKHDFCLRVSGENSVERGVVEHRPAALNAWADALRARFGGRPIAVAVEMSRGPIVSALLEHAFFVIFPVNPSTLARYRRAFAPSGAKAEPTDAQIAVDLLLRHRAKLTPLRPDGAHLLIQFIDTVATSARVCTVPVAGPATAATLLADETPGGCTAFAADFTRRSTRLLYA